MAWFARHKVWTAVIGIGVLVFVAAGIDASNDAPTPTQPPATDPPSPTIARETDAPTQRPGGVAACEHFHNVAVDYSDGQLTASELRTKIREVADSALGVNEYLYNTARDAVALLTGGRSPEDPAVQRSFSAMSRECDRVLDR